MPTSKLAAAAVGCLALIAAALLAWWPGDDGGDASSELRSREVDQSVAVVVRPDGSSAADFVVPSNYSALRAAGRCERGEVRAILTPNTPFRSLTALVSDVPVEGRIQRRYEFGADGREGGEGDDADMGSWLEDALKPPR